MNVGLLPPKSAIALVGPTDILESDWASAKPWANHNSVVSVLDLNEQRARCPRIASVSVQACGMVLVNIVGKRAEEFLRRIHGKDPKWRAVTI
jgi:hypothetical protein